MCLFRDRPSFVETQTVFLVYVGIKAGFRLALGASIGHFSAFPATVKMPLEPLSTLRLSCFITTQTDSL